MKLLFSVILTICMTKQTLAEESSNTYHQQDYLKSINSNSLSDSGQYSGFDKNKNFYRGNRKTGFYFNYGTGETCFGKNENRKCYMEKI